MDSVDRIVGCMQAASRDVGVVEPSCQDVKNIIGLGLTEAMQTLFPTIDERVHVALTDAYRNHYLYESTIATQLFDGVVETLSQLQTSGYTLAVATGKSRRGLDRVFEETDVAKYFAASRCSDETQSKPHPQMLFELLDEIGVSANEAVMIGDSEFDLMMARAAGVPSIAATYGVHDERRLLKHGPLVCLNQITDLLSHLS